MNTTSSSRSRSSLASEIAVASASVLAAFCALEAALPRAGRAAAGMLLRTDSAALQWLEKTGASVQEFSARGILFAALATCVTATAAALVSKQPLRAGAGAAILGAACLVFAQRSATDVSPSWWAALGGSVLSGAWILGSSRSASAIGAAALQAGAGAFAAWALIIGAGSGALASLDRASEALVLGGIAAAGLGAWRRGSTARSAVAVAVFAGCCSLAAARPDAAHAVIRHLVGAGNSGLPFAVTASLLAAALAGLVVATGSRGLAGPLLIALVCARRPEAWLIAGALASALLLLGRDWKWRTAASR